MFVGRERELNALEKVYSKDSFGMTIIYGRRRIGKFFLITEFLKEKSRLLYRKQSWRRTQPGNVRPAGIGSVESRLSGCNIFLYEGSF
ncbi:hypothetical protein ACTQ56_01540 [[Clostridium] aminophilum]|uniref:hypothetical protein n=1 Tax=[Clostridium] aminophilum TaxID=1526 RepID=UPI003F9E31BB